VTFRVNFEKLFYTTKHFDEVCRVRGKFMRKSTVYSFVVLTLLSLGMVLVPPAFSQTQDIKVIKYSYYIDSLGYLDVVGLVQNVGPNTVSSVLLRGSVISKGVDQGDSETQAFVSYLAPNQEAPFYMEFLQPNTPNESWFSVDVTSIDLQVVSATPTSSYQYPDLKIASSFDYVDSTLATKGTYWVNGTIQNTGSQTAQNMTVVAAFFNSTGTVVAVGYTDFLLPVSLAPSKTVPFQVGAFDINQTGIDTAQKITSYQLLVQTLEPILSGAPVYTASPTSSSTGGTSSPTGTTSPTTSPSTGTSSSPSSSSSPVAVKSNASFNPEVIYAVVIVVILIAVAGAIIVVRKSKPPQTVKQAKKAGKK